MTPRLWSFFYIISRVSADAQESFIPHASNEVPHASNEIPEKEFSMSSTEVSEAESCQADVLLQRSSRSFSARSQTETVVIESTVVRTTKTRTIHNVGENEEDVNDGMEADGYLNFREAEKANEKLKPAKASDKGSLETNPIGPQVHQSGQDFENDYPTNDQNPSADLHADHTSFRNQAANVSSQSHSTKDLVEKMPIKPELEDTGLEFEKDYPTDSNEKVTAASVSVSVPSSATERPSTATFAPTYEEDLPVVVVTQSPQVANKQGPQFAKCSPNPSSLITVPVDEPCSGACPFSQRLPLDKCHKLCIAMEDCAAFNPKRSFAEVESKQCMPACGYDKHILGCQRCAGVGVCVECMPGFNLMNNGTQCRHHMEGVWQVIYITIAVLLILLMWYLLNLARRPPINETVLEMSFQHRDQCKCWELVPDENSKHGHSWQKYPMYGTGVQVRDVGGLGIVLYFRTLGFALLACAVLLISAYITYTASDLKTYEDATALLNDCQSVAALSRRFNGGLFEHDIVEFSRYMFYAMTATYLVFLFGVSLFAHAQLNLSFRWDESRSTHEDYAFLCRGLPEDATDPKEIQEYFQSVLDSHMRCDSVHRIVGVSIAYDYKQHADLIENALVEWVEDLEKSAWVDHPSKHFQRAAKMVVRSNRWYHTHAEASESEADRQRRRSCCTAKSVLRLEFLDATFWGSCSDDDPSRASDEEVVSVLKHLKGSGDAYVVVDHPTTLALMSELGSQTLPLFRGNHKIQIKEVVSEPPGVIWENFTEMNFWPRIIAGVFVIIFVILVWVLLYIPYAVLIGEHTGFVQGLLLGVLISLGNIIVAQVIGWVTSWAGFRRKDRRDMAILSLAFLATVMNTVCDVFVVLRITNSSGGASHDFDRVLAPELFHMIVPGYLILPYLIVPMFEHVAPYFMGVWFVRSRKATLRASEQCLMCPEFDICWRYSDLLNNFTVCIMMLFVVSAESYRVMVWLAVFVLLVYLIDKYKLLRQTTQTFYTTRRLDQAALYWWCVPTSVLAAVATWWACSADFLPEAGRHKYCYLAFGINMIIYFGLVKLAEMFVRPPSPEVLRYSEMCENLAAKGKMWSWFNTNPIFCLRSYYLGLKESGASSPCIPYVPGKQHLQPTAPRHFINREGPDLYAAKLG